MLDKTIQQKISKFQHTKYKVLICLDYIDKAIKKASKGDTWTYSLDAVKSYFELLLALRYSIRADEIEIPVFDFDSVELAPDMHELVGDIYLEIARLLGERTAEMHVALLSAVYEIGYELNNRPDRFVIPFRGIRSILGTIE